MNKITEKQTKATIARRVKEVRESKGMTQHDLAKAADLLQGTISLYESGNITLNLYALIGVCDGLGVSLDYLIGRDAEFCKNTLRGRLFTAFSKMNAGQQEMFVSMTEYMVAE